MLPDDPEAFVATLAEALDRHDLSQADLARAAGKSDSEVSRWLSGRRRPSLENRLLLERALIRLTV